MGKVLLSFSHKGERSHRGENYVSNVEKFSILQVAFKYMKVFTLEIWKIFDSFKDMKLESKYKYKMWSMFLTIGLLVTCEPA